MNLVIWSRFYYVNDHLHGLFSSLNYLIGQSQTKIIYKLAVTLVVHINKMVQNTDVVTLTY